MTKTELELELELERLASRIADGEPLDWSATIPKEKDSLAQLQKIAFGFQQVLSRAPTAEETPLPLFRFGKLEVVSKLGEGSSGEVYCAYDPLLDHEVALKLRKPEADNLSHPFLDEARRLARLRHPNILSVYGAAIEDGRVGLWTELIHGTSLADTLVTQGRLSADEVRSIGRDLCHALAYIHRSGFIHGDIKPENIMRDDAGRVVLMDFGTTRKNTIAGSDGILQGSIRYLAPEVLRGNGISPSSDIYALGVTLFRLLSCCHPYPSVEFAGLMDEQERGERLKLETLEPDVPRDLRDAIECAISFDLAKRHRSALAFASALEARRSGTRWTKHWMIAASLVALICAAVVYTRPVAPGWMADASFYRVGANGREPLKDGDSVELGENFGLEFQSTKPAYLYVFDDDGTQQPAELFPSYDIDVVNPVASGAVLRLPGKVKGGTGMDWQVNTDAIRDEIIVLATVEPQEKLEQAVVSWQHASLNASLVRSGNGLLRGAYGLTPSKEGPMVVDSMVNQALGDVEKLQSEGKARYWRFSFPHRNRKNAPQ